MAKSGNNGGIILASVLAGALIGGALGVLYAPDKGEKTRKKIAKNAKKLSKQAQKTAEDLKHTAEEQISEIKKSVQETTAKMTNGAK